MNKKIHTIILFLTLAILANAQNTYTTTSLLSTGKWMKIRVKDEGVYQFTAKSLKDMGFSNPDKVRLYGYNIPVLPETNIQNLPDDLVEIPLYHSPSGTYLFYSKGVTEWKRKGESVEFSHRNNPYSSYIYYFLTEDDSTKPAEFRIVNDETSGASLQTTYYEHVLLDPDEYSFLNCGRTFFESYDYANGSIKNYKVPLKMVPKSQVNLTVQFGAAGTSSSSLAVSSGGKNLGTLSFSALQDYQYASVATKSMVLSDISSNTITSDRNLLLTLEHKRQSGTTGHLDYIRACYETNLSFNWSPLVFTPNKSRDTDFQISCFENEKLTVWNVTSPSSTYELAGTPSGENKTNPDGSVVAGEKYTVHAKGCKVTDQFIVLDKTGVYPSPERVGMVTNQNLHGLKDINLLVIVPSSGQLTAQAQRLADAHAKADGIKCAVVTAEQIYNEFSSGTPDITAYRRLAKMLYDRDNSLQNILLFGACFWDNRMITPALRSYNPNDYLLVYESDNSWSHTDSYAVEEYITLLDNGEGVSPLKEMPDAGVGRIPVTNVTEARQVVDKLIAYINNTEAGGWKNTICLMGDDGNNNIHMQDAEAVLKNTEKYYPDYRYKRIYWDSYKRQQSSTGNSYPDAINEINRTMEQGALIMNYTGHGAAYCLSHEQVLRTENFDGWTSPRLPLWFTAACDVCPFDMNTENLAVNALLNPKGAAMGFVSTARTVYSTPNRTINIAFMKRVLESNGQGERYTIGEALALAKCDVIEEFRKKSYVSRLDSINKSQYVLMGDPAIRLLTPKYKVKIDDFTSDIDDNGNAILEAGSTVTISGHIVDEEGKAVSNYDGIVYPSIYDTSEFITCFNNDGESDKPFTYYDRRRNIYSGSDSIKGGEFSFTFSVPYDLNYSDANGLMKLYAVNNTHSIEAHGTYSNIVTGSSSHTISTDTIGPKIALWLNTPAFRNGLHTSTQPTLYATLSDSTGINTTGNGIGHDIEIVIDGREALTYSLNSYFTQTVGDFTSGNIKYTIPTLEPGQHTLTFRAFDINNNPSTVTIWFVAVEGEETVDTFDFSGRRYSSSVTAYYPPGAYIRRYTIRHEGEIVEERTEKFIVTQ